MRVYGIFICFSPSADLKSEGLGRHLAEFLKAAQEIHDIKFCIAAPSWLRKQLEILFQDYNISKESFEIIVPKYTPLSLKVYNLIIAFYYFNFASFRRNILGAYLKKCKKLFKGGHGDCAENKLRKFAFISITLLLLPVLIPIIILSIILVLIYRLFNKVGALLCQIGGVFCQVLKWFQIDIKNNVITNYLRTREFLNFRKPKYVSNLMRWCYLIIQSKEESRMVSLIEKNKQVLAWYCPTLFWPGINKISAPKLVTAPDVVLNEFSIDFAFILGDIGKQYSNFINTIMGNKYFITYSQNVKYQTLVKEYGVDPDNVFVIHHGASKLNQLISVEQDSTKNKEVLEKSILKQLFKESLKQTQGHSYAEKIYSDSDLKYIFYASQARPHKNILSLLKAYGYLLRKMYIKQKLILTCSKYEIREIENFVQAHNLDNDVLFFNGLTSQQLAACFKLSDLAVNPSLSEGGFPFTFTEALSVGTPIVMARISVTEEIITDDKVREAMLFDPYDWHDMADKILQGLNYPEKLLELQLPLYNKLAKRDWRCVVRDTVNALDKIIEAESNVQK